MTIPISTGLGSGAQSFKVADDFPRIVDAELPAGLSDVSYKIDLGEIQPYKVEITEMEAVLTGDLDG